MKPARIRVRLDEAMREQILVRVQRSIKGSDHLDEAIDPDVCFIGRPVRFTKRSVRLLEITPGARWETKPTKWRFRDITRVDFGSGYEEALALIGGAPPG